MKVYQYNNLPRLKGDTTTLQDWETYLGKNPHLAKEVVKSTTNKNLTLLRIAEEFGDKIYKEGSTEKIDTFIYDWMVETGTRIRKIQIVEDCSGTSNVGAGITEFPVIMGELYYTKGSIYEFENGQQAIVTRLPERLAEGKFRYWCKVVTGKPAVFIADKVLTKGKFTKYISKASIVAELHDFGGNYVEENNIEKHRTAITRYRMDSSKSGDAASMLPNLIEHNGVWFKQPNVLTKMTEDLLDSVNRHGLFGEGNFDDNFNCVMHEDDGRTLPIGEGILPQMRRFANFMNYKGGKMSKTKLKDIVNEVTSRREQKTGNDIIVICNFRLWLEVQTVLEEIANAKVTNSDYFIRKGKKNRWDLGATFGAYEFAGNTLLFMEETAFTNQYPDKGYGVVFNLYAETSSGKVPNVNQIGIKGFDHVVNYVDGAGGRNGSTSGAVSNRLHATQMLMFKYAGFVVRDPYGTMFIEETSC